MVKRRIANWGVLLSVLCLCTAATCSKQSRPGTEPEHVLLVTFEDLRADHTSALAYFRPTTLGGPLDPNFSAKPGLDFDDLADKGCNFSRCFAPSTSTSVSLTALMTGTSPVTNGVRAEGDVLSGSFPTLADGMRAGGFQTMAFVSATTPPAQHLAQGFDQFEVRGNDVETITQAWLAARQALTEEKRMFVWIHLAEIAAPFEPAPLPAVVTQRDLSTYFADPTYGGEANGSREFLERVNRGDVPLSLEDIDHIRALYDGEVARAAAILRAFLERYVYTVKDSFGTYVDANHEDDRWERTLVVACGTQGVELGESGRFGRTPFLYDTNLHVPLFFRHPASLTGKRIFDEVVELTDVMPTLHEWFDLEVPGSVEGRSLLRIVDTYIEREFPTRPAFASSGELFSARTERWRAVWNPTGQLPSRGAPLHGDAKLELFDCREKPGRRQDVAQRHPEIAESLRAQIDAWRRRGE